MKKSDKTNKTDKKPIKNRALSNVCTTTHKENSIAEKFLATPVKAWPINTMQERMQSSGA